MDANDLPPTQKGRHHEIRGAALREFAGVRDVRARLDPFRLAKLAGLFVADFSSIRNDLSAESVHILVHDAKDKWSGGASSLRLPTGEKLIILNPTHSRKRQAATLMEEISHVFLGHRPSRLSTGSKETDDRTPARDYDHSIEEEAYATGAAALVPYLGLRSFVREGRTAAEIARNYGVSRQLVEYRIKISRLWDEYKANVFSPRPA